MLWLGLVGVLGCAPPWHPGTPETRTEPAPPGTRFAVLPLNALVPLAPELEASRGRVLGRVTQYLTAHGHDRYWVDEQGAEDLWRESVERAEADESIPNDFESAMGVFARKLGGPSRFDALLAASIVYRDAKLARGFVKWDGTTRRLPRPEGNEEKVPPTAEAIVPALSLHVMVFDPAGVRIFEGYGGLDLAHSFSKKSGEKAGLALELREPILRREQVIDDGVEIAFDPYLPRLDSSSW